MERGHVKSWLFGDSAATGNQQSARQQQIYRHCDTVTFVFTASTHLLPCLLRNVLFFRVKYVSTTLALCKDGQNHRDVPYWFYKSTCGTFKNGFVLHQTSYPISALRHHFGTCSAPLEPQGSGNMP